MSYKTGFTIVELLIVVVVIAILAAISVVAYDGIQRRAENLVNNDVIASYRKVFRLIKAGEENLPAAPSCLGDASLYPGGTCSVNGRQSSSTVNSATNALLSKYGMQIQPSTKIRNVPQIMIFAPAFYGRPTLMWSVEGNQECNQQNIWDVSLGGAAGWNATDAPYSERNNGKTFCYMSLADV